MRARHTEEVRAQLHDEQGGDAGGRNPGSLGGPWSACGRPTGPAIDKSGA